MSNRQERLPAPKVLPVCLLIGLTSACTQTMKDPHQQSASEPGRVTGTLSYRERIALPPDAVAEVWLLDTSRADAPAVELDHQTIASPGSPPIPFELGYDPARIDERLEYSVRGVIRRGDRLLFTTDTHYPVLTRGAGREVDLMLVMVDRAATRPDAPLTNTYWKLVAIDGQPYRHASDNREPHLRFLSGDSRLTGFTGCNTLNGLFRAEADQLDLAELVTTRRACPEGMEVEARLLEALGAIDRFEILGDTMRLLRGDEPLLAFEAVYF